MEIGGNYDHQDTVQVKNRVEVQSDAQMVEKILIKYFSIYIFN